MRPILSEFTVSMPREAAIIYPKEAAQIIMWADIFPGARVLEAGVGSGGLSIPLLRAIGAKGRLHSYERRQEFADVARKNVKSFTERFHLRGISKCLTWSLVSAQNQLTGLSLTCSPHGSASRQWATF